jgi:hypothetical protein
MRPRERGVGKVRSNLPPATTTSPFMFLLDVQSFPLFSRSAAHSADCPPELFKNLIGLHKNTEI